MTYHAVEPASSTAARLMITAPLRGSHSNHRAASRVRVVLGAASTPSRVIATARTADR